MRPSIPLFTRPLALLATLALLAGCQTPGTAGDAACAPAALDTLESSLTSGDYDRLREAPGNNSDREEQARFYLNAVCPTGMVSYRIPGIRQRSHACVMRGAADARIIIGAHYDKVRRGDGVVDNWTGVVLTARLASYFAELTPDYTLEFVMFGEEEPGMLGSKAFIRDHESPKDIVAMINLDTFGIGPVTIDERSTYGLECLARQVGNALGIETRSNRLRESTGDWAPFDEKNIAVLNLNSLDRAGLRLIHSPRDRFEAIDRERLEETWQFVLNLVVNLDRQFDRVVANQTMVKPGGPFRPHSIRPLGIRPGSVKAGQ